MTKLKNTLVLLEDWKEHYLNKNIGINILLSKNQIYIYCHKVISGNCNGGALGHKFINNRVSKHKYGLYYSIFRYFKVLYVLIKYRIDEINWGYMSDDELLMICLYKLLYKRKLKIFVKTDSENITRNRSFQFRKFFLEKIDKIFVENDYMADLYRSVLKHPQIIILYNPSIFEYRRFGQRIGQEFSGRLLFVGRISVEKNIHGLLNIFEKYAEGKVGACLNLILLPENQDYWRKLQLQIEKLLIAGCDIRIVFNPPIEDMYKIYLDSEVLCITSTVEGVPNVLSDAFYVGLPVVSYKVGNIPFILEDDNLLCESEFDFVRSLQWLSKKENYKKVQNHFFDFYDKRMSLSSFKMNLTIQE